MKKASKFLSMFLLVAMCFSLMSTAAYASGDILTIMSSEPEQSNSPMFYSQQEIPAETNPWKVGSNTYSSFADAYAAASDGSTIQLLADAAIDDSISIGKSLTIDLNKHVLDVSSLVSVNNNMYLSNGYIKTPKNLNMVGGTLTVSAVNVGDSGSTQAATADDFSTGFNGKVIVSDSLPATAAVAKVGSVYYDDIDAAFAAAAASTGKDVTIELTKSSWEYDVTSFPTDWKCNSVTLNIGENVLNVGSSADFGSAKLTVNGKGTLKGTVTVNRDSTLNVVKAESVTADGVVLTVNGTTVDSVSLKNAATLSVPSSKGATIKALTLDGSKNILNVGAGTFGTSSSRIEFPAVQGTAGITNGVWYIADGDQNYTNFKANVKNGYATTSENNYYKVGSGSTGSGATGGNSTTISSSTPSSGTYTLNNFTYTLTTDDNVAIWPVSTATWNSSNSNLYFYYTPNTAAADGLTYKFYLDSTSWQIPGESYTDNLAGTMSIGKSLLANLSEGVHTVYLVCDGKTASCTFYIPGSLKAVDTDKHVINSTKSLQFYSSQPISRVSVGDVDITDNYGTYYTLSSDRKTLTLTSDFLNDRTAGSTYTLTVTTDSGNKLSTSFQVLTTAQASSSPKTGDASNLALWAAVLVLSGGAAIAVLPRVKKNED